MTIAQVQINIGGADVKIGISDIVLVAGGGVCIIERVGDVDQQGLIWVTNVGNGVSEGWVDVNKVMRKLPLRHVLGMRRKYANALARINRALEKAKP